MILPSIYAALESRFRSRDRYRTLLPSIFIVLMLQTKLSGCDSGSPVDSETPSSPASVLNFDHLDFLGENISHGGETLRLIHIYSESPGYSWVADADEGMAAVDDAARAAVVYLNHYAFSGDPGALEKGKQLLRFIMYMQTSEGLFYNFVWDNTLRINKTHPNSRAERFEWWASRAVWALGTGAQVLKNVDPDLSQAVAARVRLTYTHLEKMLDHYNQFGFHGGDTVPLWLVSESASDATSELLLGLTALNSAYPDSELRQMIDLFGDGLAVMQKGTMASFPFGAHVSAPGIWHGWGNSQTQALAESGRLQSAILEADNFYPHLLISGWRKSFSITDISSTEEFEQIAYAVRCVSVGLIKLHEATGDARYAVMAGLAASWFFGNNVAGTMMYDSSAGRAFDGISSPFQFNSNAGAESTIEALHSIMEVERIPQARVWMRAVAGEIQEVTRNEKNYRYRIFTRTEGGSEIQIALVMNLSDEILLVLDNEALQNLLED